jgi:hypothetical protein
MQTILMTSLITLLALSGAHLPAQTPRSPRTTTQQDTLAPVDSAVTVPSYLESSTFFEKFHKNYSDDLNRTLLYEGKVRLEPLGTENIENFDWMTHRRTDQSWWQRIESLVYLLPLMASKKEQDKVFVRNWITGWLDTHEKVPLLNNACKDAMTVGQRGMVLAWYVRQSKSDDEPDPILIERIKVSLYWHQTYLEETYHPVSNHAMWEAMGLLETTRVHPNPKLAFIALERLREIVGLSTSAQGFHTEQSTVYHFYYLRWLSDFTKYLSSLPDLDWPELDMLVDRKRRMHDMTYYLCDHGGRLPQIGDTDSLMVDDVYWRRPPRSKTRAVFDETAGYAIFKDRRKSKNRRYVLFRILKGRPELPFHTHDDCLAVYYSWDGEVILSDQGRYSYTRSATRRYYTSISAHNIVVPSRLLPFQGYKIYAKETWWDNGEDYCFFGASLGDESITRAVEIPVNEPDLHVFDTVLGDEPFSLLWHIGSDVVNIGECQENVCTSDSTGRWKSYAWELTTAKERRFLLTIEASCRENDDDVMMHIISGWDKPRLGWYSSGFNKSVPANVIRIDINVQSYANVRTRITHIR